MASAISVDFLPGGLSGFPYFIPVHLARTAPEESGQSVHLPPAFSAGPFQAQDHYLVSPWFPMPSKRFRTMLPLLDFRDAAFTRKSLRSRIFPWSDSRCRDDREGANCRSAPMSPIPASAIFPNPVGRSGT
jgi:hypothetical protein